MLANRVERASCSLASWVFSLSTHTQVNNRATVAASLDSERCLLGAVDALASGAVVVGEVTALAHEVTDHTVEARALVAKAGLSSAQLTEVLSSPTHNSEVVRTMSGALWGNMHHSIETAR